jgi:predicted glutamine amidotransferase
MCGHVGIYSTIITGKEHSIFQDMLIFDTVRGYHGTGIAAVDKDNSWRVVKSDLTAAEFLIDSEVGSQPFIKLGANLKALIGHNRQATQGVVNPANAHPFEFTNVVGAHNGTLSKWDFQNFPENNFDVDSKMIFNHIDKHNVDGVWENTDGAMALVWFDKRDGNLHIAKNNQRTLFYTTTPDKKTLLWASEPWMLRVACSRQGFKIEEPVSFENDKHYSISFDNQGRLVKTTSDLPAFSHKINYPAVVRWPGKETFFQGGGDKNTYKDQDAFVITNIKYLDNRKEKIHYAEGVTRDGEFIKVNVPFFISKRAKNEMVGRGFTSGIYTPKRLIRSHEKEFDFFVDYQDVSWERLEKTEKIVVVKGFGFKIINKNTPVVGEYAPYLSSSTQLTKDAWFHKIKCGCGICGATPSWEEREVIKWLNHESFLCLDCKDDAPLLEAVGV